MNYKTDTVAIRKIMVEKNMISISKLSERSGIGRDTLSKVLNGKTQPSSDVMCKLVSTLEISPENAGRIFFTINIRNA